MFHFSLPFWICFVCGLWTISMNILYPAWHTYLALSEIYGEKYCFPFKTNSGRKKHCLNFFWEVIIRSSFLYLDFVTRVLRDSHKQHPCKNVMTLMRYLPYTLRMVHNSVMTVYPEKSRDFTVGKKISNSQNLKDIWAESCRELCLICGNTKYQFDDRTHLQRKSKYKIRFHGFLIFNNNSFTLT